MIRIILVISYVKTIWFVYIYKHHYTSRITFFFFLRRNFFKAVNERLFNMNHDNYEHARPKWNPDPCIIPAVVCPQPQGPMISLIFKSTWGSSMAEIQGAKVQDQEGKVVDVLISDKWYLNADLFPESVNFPLVVNSRPAFILIQNGLSTKGVKEMEVKFAEKQIWCGEVPMATIDNCLFPIAVPIENSDFQKPNIHTFRNTKTSFTMA
ncbi:hypothetical protein TRFO_29004 [Tritrichomonas foetus]|uniref:Uncharacterized protein n=1 Tax=Tritrichomonas foetus TaxID=1144522 RepID=A0A1J4JWP9_9EUKA|nr:hypothetical protein TRFO_29004 [Tritrichomonas foetus]|eukprot:OHT03575.1 hypothetical protein TRFO_29004 [Tritrichomonas foetus]